MNISVIGAGYVGLVTAAGLAEFGNSVVCYDQNEERILGLSSHPPVLPFYEPGLDDLVLSNVAAGRLVFTSDRSFATRSNIIFVAVGTPQSEDGSADMSAVNGVVADLSDSFDGVGTKFVVMKSTVPVGTGDFIESVLRKSGVDAHVVSNPEFLREGTAVEDFLRPDRIVIGTTDRDAEEIMRRVYRPLLNVTRFICVDRRSSELSKYASNSMLASRISFMNEMAALCDAVGADVDSIRVVMGSDTRIGPKYLYPGVGFGGSCFTKDLSALRRTCMVHGVHHSMISATLDANDRQKRAVLDKILSSFPTVSDRKICIWGLAFKANTDDIRDSPSLALIDGLLKQGASVHVHDPKAIPATMAVYGQSISYYGDMYSAASGSDAICVMTEWREYRSPKWDSVRLSSPEVIIFDGRNVLSPDDVTVAGLTYRGVGRGLS